MSAPQPPPLYPPAWHYHPSFARWLWWDGYRWVDPSHPQPYWPSGFYGTAHSAPVEEFPEAPSTWWPPLSTLRFPAAIVSFVFMLAMVFTQLAIPEDSTSASTALLALAVLGASVIGMPAVAFICSHRWGSRGVLRSIGFRIRWIDLLLGIVSAGGMFVMMAIINLTWMAFGGETGSNLEVYESTEPGDARFFFLFLFVLAGIVAPITEELLFRGSLFRGLLDRIGTWPALIIQGFFFGSVHYTPGQGWGNANLMFSLGMLGVALGVLTKLTGRLGAAIVAHAVFNMTAVGMLWLSMNA